LVIDEDLGTERKRRSVVEAAEAEKDLIRGQQVVEQARPALVTEAALGPFGRLEAREVLGARELDAFRAHDHQRTAAPAPAHAAVANMKVLVSVADPERHRTAQTSAGMCCHLAPLARSKEHAFCRHRRSCTTPPALVTLSATSQVEVVGRVLTRPKNCRNKFRPCI